jgi:hypothetical protein
MCQKCHLQVRAVVIATELSSQVRTKEASQLASIMLKPGAPNARQNFITTVAVRAHRHKLERMSRCRRIPGCPSSVTYSTRPALLPRWRALLVFQ